MLSTLFSLEGRSALVTGGSRGIGKMIASGLVAAGATVCISSRDAAQCEKTQQELSALGSGRCWSIVQDISSVEGCRALAAKYLARDQLLDILVNNAGGWWAQDFDEFSEAGWDAIMGLNLKSPFFLVQSLHGLLAKSASAARPAKVINISSVDGIRLNPMENYSYQASKAALIYLTRRMAARLARDHIVVNGIAPGPFPTDMNLFARFNPEPMIQGTPLRRLGTPEDIAGAAIYLASRAGDYVVGDTISVDGGIAYALDG
jgi:2-deoxy-D-gluconate 3-dehydrogenase